MIEIINNMLTEMEIGFHVEKEGNIESVIFTVILENGTVRGLISANNEEQQILIHIEHPTTIPEHKRQIICELIARINYNDLFGGFIINMEDGYLAYQCGFLFDENSDTHISFLNRHFKVSYNRLDYYLPVILEVAFGGKEPAQVLDELEHQVDPRLN